MLTPNESPIASPIVVQCPECGVARVAADQVTVRRCVESGAGSYRFTCPTCQLLTVGESAMSALMRAVDAGAGFETWNVPAAEERPDGPPFTVVDVLVLHLMMIEPDWFDRVLSD